VSWLERRRERADFVAWARAHAIALDGVDPARGAEVLAPLDPLLAGKRIAFLGEANHWVHEKYDYRLLFLHWLRARGFGVIGEELSWSDGWRVNRFLATGDERELERVTACGYRGDRRGDRDDSPTGILKQGFDSYPFAPFRAEQTRFAHALRELGFHLFGLDVDYESGAAYALLEDALGSDAPELRAAIARVPGESLAEEIARLTACSERVERERWDAVLGPERCAFLRRTLRTAARSHEYVRLAHPAPDYEALRPAMALREELMLEHVEHELARLAPSGKLVLLAHDFHLARDDAGIQLPGGAVGPGGGTARSLGASLWSRYPNQIFSVWMLEGRGRSHGPPPEGEREIRAGRRTLNALLAGVGAAFVLPTRSEARAAAPLHRESDVALLYGQRARVGLAAQTDAVYFARDVTPIRVG
jgi:erythromycin esterase-like protein